ncbi:MAG: homoserine dehydrogenase [Kiritimatiellae bacterium]|nr:homoserine dehydrogenase [Kiritimatiellia bacterium]
MKTVGIGLLGFGTVGAGVVMGLQKNKALLENRTGLKLELRSIADIDLDRDRGVSIPPGVLTRDAEAVVARADIDIVVELIGGLKAARDLIIQALKLGKPVVTANKALLAEHGAELFQLAEANRTDIFFEASVGGGIPLIRSLREGLVSNHISSIYGILNGTCNYILTRMEQNRMTFASALKEAQKAGYAEADPALDVDGIDTAHKAVILASLAYGFNVSMQEVGVEGIRGLDALDLRYALELGYRIKMLAVIEQENGDVAVRVCPTLVPMQHILASVSGVFNAVLIEGDEVGDVLCYGKGAGRDSTASAILSDVVDAGRNLVFHAARRAPGFVGYNPLGKVKAVGETDVRYYLRLTLPDRPGVFGQIATILGRHGISLASVLQKENMAGRQVPIIIITHHGKEKAFRAALDELDALPVVGAKTVRFRIEDF